MSRYDENLWLIQAQIDASRSYHFQGASGITHAFLFPRSRVAGMYVDCIGVRSKEDIISTMKVSFMRFCREAKVDGLQAVRKALWIAHLLRSCVSEMQPVSDMIGDLDDELDELLTGRSTLVRSVWANAHMKPKLLQEPPRNRKTSLSLSASTNKASVSRFHCRHLRRRRRRS